jgi:hypothetical protein
MIFALTNDASLIQLGCRVFLTYSSLLLQNESRMALYAMVGSLF